MKSVTKLMDDGVTSEELTTALLNMYGKCGHLEKAEVLFNAIPNKVNGKFTQCTFVFNLR